MKILLFVILCFPCLGISESKTYPNKIGEVTDAQFKPYEGLFLEIDTLEFDPEIKYESWDKKVDFHSINSIFDASSMKSFSLKEGQFVDCKKVHDLVDIQECINGLNHFRRVRILQNKTSLHSVMIPVDFIISKYRNGFGIRTKDTIFEINNYLCGKFSNRCRIHRLQKDTGISQIYDFVSNTFYYSYLFRDRSPEPGEEVMNPKIEINTILSPDLMDSKDQFIAMRGHYLKMYFSTEDNEIKVYETSDLSKEPQYRIVDNEIKFKDKECYLNSEGKWMEKSSDDPKGCSVFPSYRLYDKRGNHTTGLAYFFKYVSIDPELNYVKVNFNNKEYFIDTRGCKTSVVCMFVFYPQTSLENKLLELEKHKKNRDLANLNFLISNLKPCVDKKDIKCIESFFVNSKSKYKQGPEECIDNGVIIPNYSFRIEDIDELKQCLSYDSLLPHLLALKGNKKVCAFAPPHTLKDKSAIKLLFIGSAKSVQSDYTQFKVENHDRGPIPLTMMEYKALLEK